MPVPVFPLPGTVFFPRTELPLHVFEARYREMVRDALAGDRLIVMTLLAPGWEKNYDGRPPIHSIGTLGRIEDLVQLDDGRFDLLLLGLRRVAIHEEPSGKLYRLAKVESLPERPADETDLAVRRAKLELLASHDYLMRELNQDEQSSLVLDDQTSFELAVNAACADLPVEAAKRQALLEEGDLRARQQRVSKLIDELLFDVLQLKALRPGTQRGILA